MFTGDRSGEWLYGALYRHGFASQADSVSREDGLLLRDCYITAALRCAPPNNRPTPGELSRCEPYLARELGLLPRVSVIVALGQIAFRTALKVLRSIRVAMPSPTPKFGHGLAYRIGGFMLLGSYHPSQQNTFTGKLTQPMFDRIFEMTKEFLSAKPPQSPA
jgi:uracil-DNA glycosylase family 4